MSLSGKSLAMSRMEVVMKVSAGCRSVYFLSTSRWPKTQFHGGIGYDGVSNVLVALVTRLTYPAFRRRLMRARLV
jgi:hypothetical protein